MKWQQNFLLIPFDRPRLDPCLRPWFTKISAIKDKLSTPSGPCPGGTYKTADMITCEKCEINTISNPGASSCTECSPGSVSNSDNTACGRL